MADRPHDALFRETCSDPVEAAAELKAVLPSAVVSLFDWDTLALESGSLVTVDTRRACDLLFRVERRDASANPALVFVLFEHQSSEDALMPLRILGYMVKIWDAWVARHNTPSLPLPFILPVVLTHHEGGWRAATRMAGLFDPEGAAPLRPFVPDFELVLDDIARASDQELLDRMLPIGALLTVWALRDGRRPERLLAHVRAFAPVFERFSQVPGFEGVLDRIFIYLGQAAGPRSVPIETFAKTMAEHAPNTKRAVMNSLEKLLERGRQEGRLEGRLEGRQEGRLEGRQEGPVEGLELGVARGKRTTLVHLLELKFGALTEAQHARVEQAPVAELDRYLERVLTADSPDAVFGG